MSKSKLTPKPQSTLSDADLNKISKIVADMISDILPHILAHIDSRTENLVTKEDLSYVPTKDEFYTEMDKLTGIMKSNTENQDLLNLHDQEQSDKIEVLEKLHQPTHAHFAV